MANRSRPEPERTLNIGWRTRGSRAARCVRGPARDRHDALQQENPRTCAIAACGVPTARGRLGAASPYWCANAAPPRMWCTCTCVGAWVRMRTENWWRCSGDGVHGGAEAFSAAPARAGISPTAGRRGTGTPHGRHSILSLRASSSRSLRMIAFTPLDMVTGKVTSTRGSRQHTPDAGVLVRLTCARGAFFAREELVAGGAAAVTPISAPPLLLALAPLLPALGAVLSVAGVAGVARHPHDGGLGLVLLGRRVSDAVDAEDPEHWDRSEFVARQTDRLTALREDMSW
eukprot:scaffold1509_cov110-Isochrysis_galbana.AAC.3